MILISPKGKKKEMDDARAEKFLEIPSKRKQGWKKATDKVNEKSLNNLKQKKPKVKQEPKTKNPVAKKKRQPKKKK